MEANYTLTQQDIDAGVYTNVAEVRGSSPSGTNDISMVSDAGTDKDGNTITNPLTVDGSDTGTDPTDDPTILDISSGQGTPSMTMIKSVVSTGPYNIGSTIDYELVVTNTGTTTITNIEITDAGATIVSGNPIASLAPGNSTVVRANYILTSIDIDNGSYTNTATAEGDALGGVDNVNTVSDAGTDENGNTITNPSRVDGSDVGTDTTDDPTVLNISSDQGAPSMTMIKSVVSTGPYGLGDVVNYELTITNTGNVTLTNVQIIDTGAIITSGNASLPSLEPNDSFVVEATYTIRQFDVDNGVYVNLASATADTPQGNNISIISDTGTDENGNIITNPLEVDSNSDGNATNDATVLTVTPCLFIFNEFSPNGDGVNDYLKISCISDYPNNTIEIFNRWGNTVYKVKGYNNNEITFKGVSEGRVNINTDEKLPTGTYFYVLDLGNGKELLKGWLYLNR